MADPLDGGWDDSDVNVTASNLNGTTHGSGTTAERTAITSWPANRPFFDETLGQWFSNTHASAPSSITWTAILGRQPQKRRCVIGAGFERESMSNTDDHYFGIIGQWGPSSTSGVLQYDTSTISRVAMPVTDKAITIKRVRAFIQGDGIGGSGTFDVELYNETDNSSIHNFNTTSPVTYDHLDSGDISVSVDGGDSLYWRYQANADPSGDARIAVLFEYEYDDVY